VSFIEDWNSWPLNKLILVGPEGSGKTHLASLWAEEVGAKILSSTDLMEEQISKLSGKPVLIEDIHKIQRNRPAETIFFHLHNLLNLENTSLLMTSRLLPGRLNFILEDLQSRILGSSIAELEAVDDDLLSAVLVKMFADRQMYFSDKLLAYVLLRIERSYIAIKTFVEEVDSRAMTENRVIGKRLVRDILDKGKQS
jgi:chromosomal replication initiation ATPase DnaA